MKNSTTIEEQKILAEFVGSKTQDVSSVESIPRVDYFIEGIGWVREDNLKFNSSWDWLMSVVEKIESISFGKFTGFNMGSSKISASFMGFLKEVNEEGLILEPIIKPQKGKDRFECTYKAVVEFVKWYNKMHKDFR